MSFASRVSVVGPAIAQMLSLTKFPITFMVAMSAAAGFFCSGATIGPDLGFMVVGVFLLAMGAAVLNQVQDAKIDGMMARTANRPVPSGRITPRSAAVIALAQMMMGSLSLLAISRNGPWVLALGWSAVIWYNGVYYALKRITAFAAVPGALIGAIPPAMGWLSGGGNLLHPLCLSLCAFVFLWQIPHFWLLMLHRANEYHQARLPVISMVGNRSRFRRIVAIWILAVAAGGMVFPLLMRLNSPEIARWAMVAVSMGLAVLAFLFFLVAETSNRHIRRTFSAMNGYIFLMLLALSLASI